MARQCPSIPRCCSLQTGLPKSTCQGLIPASFAEPPARGIVVPLLCLFLWHIQSAFRADGILGRHSPPDPYSAPPPKHAGACVNPPNRATLIAPSHLEFLFSGLPRLESHRCFPMQQSGDFSRPLPALVGHSGPSYESSR